MGVKEAEQHFNSNGKTFRHLNELLTEKTQCSAEDNFIMRILTFCSVLLVLNSTYVIQAILNDCIATKHCVIVEHL